MKLEPRPGPASEDYSEFIRAGVPSVFFAVGALDAKAIAEAKAAGRPPPVNHSPYFAPAEEPTLRRGVEAMSLAVLNVLAPPQGASAAPAQQPAQN